MILPLGETSVTLRVGGIATQISSCANTEMHLLVFLDATSAYYVCLLIVQWVQPKSVLECQIDRKTTDRGLLGRYTVGLKWILH